MHDARPRDRTVEPALTRHERPCREAVQRAALEERYRLARELHDSVAQTLSSTSLYAEAAARNLRAGDVRSATADVEHVRAAARQAHAEIRLILATLRPPDDGKRVVVALPT